MADPSGMTEELKVDALIAAARMFEASQRLFPKDRSFARRKLEQARAAVLALTRTTQEDGKP